MRSILKFISHGFLTLVTCCIYMVGNAQEIPNEGYNKTITLTNFEAINSQINENCFNKIGREYFLLEIDIADSKFFPTTMKLSQAVYKTRETLAIEDLRVEEFYYLLNHDMIYTGTVVSYNLKDYIFAATKRHGEGVIKSGQTLQLYTANIEDEYFSNIKRLPFCQRDYNYCHASISENGNLMVFSSDMPGGQGGYDLYATVRVNGKWTKPLNLGPKVNSLDDELYPYYSADGFLYFSSDKFGGAGGTDIYVCERLDNGWTAAANLGQPYNSKSNDYGFRILNYEGYGTMTSDRSGGMGMDDVYTFRHFREQENRALIEAMDSKSEIAEQPDDTLASTSTSESTTTINNYFNFLSPDAADEMNADAKVAYYTTSENFDQSAFEEDPAKYCNNLPLTSSQNMKVGELGNLIFEADQIVHIMIKGYEDIFMHSNNQGEQPMDFTFKPLGLRHLPGHVIFSDGQPVADITVELTSTDGSSTLKAMTDENGKFSSRVFGHKEYEVRIYDKDVQMLETFTFDPSQFDQLVIDMSMSRDLHGKILDAINNIPEINESTLDFDLEDNTPEPAVASEETYDDVDVMDAPKDAEHNDVTTAPVDELEYTGDDIGNFYVITGTFASERRAIRRRELMRSIGFDEVQLIKVDGSPYYRVCVGAFQDLNPSILKQNEALPTVDDTFILRKPSSTITIIE